MDKRTSKIKTLDNNLLLRQQFLIQQLQEQRNRWLNQNKNNQLIVMLKRLDPNKTIEDSFQNQALITK